MLVNEQIAESGDYFLYCSLICFKCYYNYIFVQVIYCLLLKNWYFWAGDYLKGIELIRILKIRSLIGRNQVATKCFYPVEGLAQFNFLSRLRQLRRCMLLCWAFFVKKSCNQWPSKQVLLSLRRISRESFHPWAFSLFNAWIFYSSMGLWILNIYLTMQQSVHERYNIIHLRI